MKLLLVIWLLSTLGFNFFGTVKLNKQEVPFGNTKLVVSAVLSIFIALILGLPILGLLFLFN